MLSEHLKGRFNHIVGEAAMMVFANTRTDDLTHNIDFATIYAKSHNDYYSVLNELDKSGSVSHVRESGSYFKLTDPLIFHALPINHVRVRKYDLEHVQEGYADFEVKNFEDFKRRYLQKPRFSLVEGENEMIELVDPVYIVRAYFPRDFNPIVVT